MSAVEALAVALDDSHLWFGGRDDAAAVLEALGTSGWQLVEKQKPDEILVFDENHVHVVGTVTFGVGEGSVHSHSGFGFHAHKVTS